MGIRPVNFSEKYNKEEKHFLNMKNRSNYVCELIRQDMKKKIISVESNNELKELIIDTIKEVLPSIIDSNSEQGERIKKNETNKTNEKLKRIANALDDF